MCRQVSVVRADAVHVAVASEPLPIVSVCIALKTSGASYMPQKDPKTTSQAFRPPSGYVVSSSSPASAMLCSYSALLESVPGGYGVVFSSLPGGGDMVKCPTR